MTRISCVSVLYACAMCLLVNRAVTQMVCNENVSSLDKMLKMASQSNQTEIVCVELESPVQILNYSNVVIPFSVVLKPAPTVERCTVTCDNNVSLPPTNYNQFPLIFNMSDFVVIENIDFVGCVRPIQIFWVRNVTLIDTTFSDFSAAGALEISNSPLIHLEGCRFTNNTSEGIGQNRYSGNSGGLSIGYDTSERLTESLLIKPLVNVIDTSFVGNLANASENFIYEVSFVLRENLFNQRGGAMAVYIGTPNYQAQILIHNCTFKSNEAKDSGGGIYMNIGGANNSHTIIITESHFVDNKGPDGGGLEITQYSPDAPHHLVNITNCQFVDNRAVFGGGYKSIQAFTYLNSVNLYNCTFRNNSARVGAALYLQSIYTIHTSTITEESIIQDCEFVENRGNRGTLFVIQNSVGIRGNTLFKNNTGPVLRILQCLVSLGGNIFFVDNHAHPEGFAGALYFSQYGQILLKSGVNISFINNTGIEGACIVARGQLLSAGFPEQLYNPQCFIQYEIATVPTDHWNVSMMFQGNRALIGPVMYTSDLSPCQWYSEEQPFFSLENSDIWPFMDMRDNYITRGNVTISREDYVQTDIHSLVVNVPNNTNITAPPGTTVTVDIMALDQLNRSTSAFLELLNDPDTSDDVEFEPNIAQIVAGNHQINFSYSSPKLSGETDVILKASFISTENIPNASLILVHELCLPGYVLEDDRCVCEDGSRIILFCLPEYKGVLLADGLWGAPPSWSRDLVTHTCPSGYCNCTGDKELQEIEGCPLYFENSNKICDNTREGLLCGKCKENMGVGLLTNICRKYPYAFAQAYILVPVYLALLVVVLVIIVRKGIHLPPIFRGFLFYIQVSSVAAAYLPSDFRLKTYVMDCIWSTTALYVPYDFSFHGNLTSLESYSLRYITPVVAFLVVPLAARVGRKHSKYWHGVWTIIILMYTRAIDTSVSLLHCPTLYGRRAEGELDVITLWFFDGSVKCFQGAHIFLTILSIAMLIFLITLIPLTALIIYHRKIKRTGQSLERVEKLAVAITKGFKDDYKWWPVMELLCRFVFMIVVLATPGLNFIPLVLSLVLLFLQMTAQPYKDKWANTAETFTLFCLVALLALGNTTPVIIASRQLPEFTLWPLFFLPVAVGGVLAIAFTTYIIGKWCKAQRKIRLRKLDRSERQRRLQRLAASISMKAGARTVTTTIVGIDDTDDEYELVNKTDCTGMPENSNTGDSPIHCENF